MAYENARLTKMDLAILDNDVSFCYDHIIPKVALLACCQLGMTPQCCTLLAKSLCQMKYHISTAPRIDQRPISESPNSQLFGTGQGSGASPAVWLAMSEVLIQALKSSTTGTFFTS